MEFLSPPTSFGAERHGIRRKRIRSSPCSLSFIVFSFRIGQNLVHSEFCRVVGNKTRRSQKTPKSDNKPSAGSDQGKSGGIGID